MRLSAGVEGLQGVSMEIKEPAQLSAVDGKPVESPPSVEQLAWVSGGQRPWSAWRAGCVWIGILRSDYVARSRVSHSPPATGYRVLRSTRQGRRFQQAGLVGADQSFPNTSR